MTIRQKVFIEEQGVSPESELDEDDARSWQWVLYLHNQGNENGNQNDDTKKEKEKMAIGVIRLVPPPHEPHETLLHPDQDQTRQLPKYDVEHEPYIKLTRVAILPEYRGKGFARILVDTALDWAGKNPEEIEKAYLRTVQSHSHTQSQSQTAPRWTGLALLHAQIQVEKMYERLGFHTDESLGRWMEEGIEHVGMWRRVDVRQ